MQDSQIDRYSRQIIVAGGIAQERLLAARIVIAGDVADIGPALDYLAGAGVGRINLQLTGDPASREALMAFAREINRDVSIEADHACGREAAAALFLIVGNLAAVELAAKLYDEAGESPVVIARLDRPARIATLPAPPIDAAAELNLFAPVSARDDNAGLVAMVAATEVLKLLMGDQAPSNPTVIEFDGYQTHQVIKPR